MKLLVLNIYDTDTAMFCGCGALTASYTSFPWSCLALQEVTTTMKATSYNLYKNSILTLKGMGSFVDQDPFQYLDPHSTPTSSLGTGLCSPHARCHPSSEACPSSRWGCGLHGCGCSRTPVQTGP